MQWGKCSCSVFLVVAGYATIACSSDVTAPSDGDASTDTGGSGGKLPAAGGRPSGGAGGGPAGSSAGGAAGQGGRGMLDAGRNASDAGRVSTDAGMDADALVCGDAAPPAPLPVGGSCGPHQYLYVDQGCAGPLPPDSSIGGQCDEVGDGRCHDRCTSDRDCTDPCRPHCTVLGLFDQGDYNCNAGVRICRAEPKDDCAYVWQLL